jgi:hypothetical protein
MREPGAECASQGRARRVCECAFMRASPSGAMGSERLSGLDGLVGTASRCDGTEGGD